MTLLRFSVPLAIGLWCLFGCEDRAERVTVPATSAAVEAELRSIATVAACTGETPLVPGVPGSPGHLIADSVNPNGASELALLMRSLRGDLATVREKVLAGKPARIPASHHRIRCAWPTNPVDRDRRFDALAVGYLQAVDAFNAQNGRAEFDAMVDACVRCHEGACSGALVAIRPLRIEASAEAEPEFD
jgi:hypothetical protein